ncbi:IS21 family transposase [Corynebacterium cystitidis]|uniref:IS21 family transposase n=1 Tax=Corynebacterium cystitidis TaxID=35757 RepID=UPI00211EAF1B|nr:IS21 family transposase [Corynebacterium cystitidis]
MTDYRAIMSALSRGDRSWNVLAADLGVSKRTLAKAASVVKTHRLDAAAVAAMSDEQISLLFPDSRRRDEEQFLAPDFDVIADKRLQGQRVTLKVEHAHYLQQPAGLGQQHYSYRQFCSLFSDYVDVNQLRAVISHDPGDELMVDWSGNCLQVVDPITRESMRAELFVTVLPFSGLLHASAWPDQKTRSWLMAHRAALEYIGGVPCRLVPDNAPTATYRPVKSVKTRAVVPSYQQFAVFYGTAVTAAASYKPRHKAAVEKAVDITQTWIVEYFQDVEFGSFDELNTAIAGQVEFINNRKGFRGLEMSRRDIFTQFETEALRPLPDQRWSYSTWKRPKVRMDYHVQINKHFYSVPYRYAGTYVDAQIFDDHLKIYANGKCIASHRLQPGNYRHSTLDEHVPARHKDLTTKWDKNRIMGWAQSIGAATGTVIGQMFHARTVEAHAYSSTLAVLSLANQYSRPLLEAACQQLLDTKSLPSVKKITRIIRDVASASTSCDTTTPPAASPTTEPLNTSTSPAGTAGKPTDALVRGKDAFDFTTNESRW